MFPGSGPSRCATMSAASTVAAAARVAAVLGTPATEPADESPEVDARHFPQTSCSPSSRSSRGRVGVPQMAQRNRTASLPGISSVPLRRFRKQESQYPAPWASLTRRRPTADTPQMSHFTGAVKRRSRSCLIRRHSSSTTTCRSTFSASLPHSLHFRLRPAAVRDHAAPGRISPQRLFCPKISSTCMRFSP